MRVPYKLGGGVLILFYFIFIFPPPGWKGAAVRGAGEARFVFSFWFRCSGFGHQPPVQISKQAPELENAFH
jgi:hypothetical protein